MQQVNFKHCWIDSASARYEQEYMISFIISQKSVMPDRILRRYLLSSTSPAAASVRLLISTAPLSTLFYSLHAFGRYVNPFMRILNFYTFCPLRHWLPLSGERAHAPRHRPTRAMIALHPDLAHLYKNKPSKRFSCCLPRPHRKKRKTLF